jgi:hypothetical protein
MLVRGTKAKEPAMAEALTNSIAFVGIDIGKNSFHVVGLDKSGAIVLRQKRSRGQVEARFANMPSCLIGNWERQTSPITCITVTRFEIGGCHAVCCSYAGA